MPRGKKAAPRQPDLPAEGMSRREIPAIEEPAEDVRVLKLERAGLNEKIRAAQTALHEAMVAEAVVIHKYMDGDNVPRVARIKDRPSVSVERDKSAAVEDEDDGGVEVH